MAKKNAFYAQSGGVTAVINASACGVIETARKHKDKIGKVYAGRNGIIGALTEDLIDTGKEPHGHLPRCATRPPARSAPAATSSRAWKPTWREYERLIEVFKAHNIGYFFYNGGGDSADTCYKVSQLSKNWAIRCRPSMCPRPWTTTCRSPTAAPVSARWRNTSPSPRWKPGSTSPRWPRPRPRYSSWKSWAAMRAGSRRRAGWSRSTGIPVVILFPEIEFDQKKFLANVDAKVKKYGYCSVVVSEGCHYPEGRFLAEQGTRTPSAMRNSAARHRSSPT